MIRGCVVNLDSVLFCKVCKGHFFINLGGACRGMKYSYGIMPPQYLVHKQQIMFLNPPNIHKEKIMFKNTKKRKKIMIHTKCSKKRKPTMHQFFKQAPIAGENVKVD